MKRLLVLILFFNTTFAFSQITENKLIGQFKQINYWYEYQRSHPTTEVGDSLVKANEDFQNMLLKFGRNPGSLKADLKKLKAEGVWITSSADGVFRIYSWDTELGGSMHIYYNVYQYKSNGKVYTQVISDGKFESGRWFSKIYLHKIPGKVYYLGINHSNSSGMHHSQEIRAFEISNGRLSDQAKVIKTKQGLTNNLHVYFDFSSVLDRKERPVKLISYDEATKTIKIPVVDDRDQVLKRNISYRFDGKYFVKQ